MGRYSQTEIESFVRRVLEDGFCVLPGHFARERMEAWRAAFAPMLERHVAREGHLKNRGPARYYVTLPFAEPFADPAVYEDDDVLAVVRGSPVRFGVPRCRPLTSRTITSPAFIKSGSSFTPPDSIRRTPSSFDIMCVPRVISKGPFSRVTSTSGKLTASWKGGVSRPVSGKSGGASRCTS